MCDLATFEEHLARKVGGRVPRATNPFSTTTVDNDSDGHVIATSSTLLSLAASAISPVGTRTQGR